MSESLPSEAPAEDWAEQREPANSEEPATALDDLADATLEANEADLMEQAIDVPLDDDYDRDGS
jgi:hypothetical protein